MKKNISKKSMAGNKGNYHRGAYEAPEVIDMDSLSYFDDESLERRHGYLQVEREKIINEGVEALPWEVEICYVQREIRLRNTRRVLHDKYIRSNPEHQYYDNEASEPEYDRSAN